VFTLFVIAAPHAAADTGSRPGYGFGTPGTGHGIARTVEILASDDLRFSPAKIEVRAGETVRFVVKNVGSTRHEFAVGDRAAQHAHAQMMRKYPGMKHGDSATTVVLEPGETKTLMWKFDRPGPIELACHVPGHYEAGMKIDVVWAK
ncbi:MAG: cupredoxin family protein, partial [Burkholderiales bacterium]